MIKHDLLPIRYYCNAQLEPKLTKHDIIISSTFYFTVEIKKRRIINI